MSFWLVLCKAFWPTFLHFLLNFFSFLRIQSVLWHIQPSVNNERRTKQLCVYIKVWTYPRSLFPSSLQTPDFAKYFVRYIECASWKMSCIFLDKTCIFMNFVHEKDISFVGCINFGVYFSSPNKTRPQRKVLCSIFFNYFSAREVRSP